MAQPFRAKFGPNDLPHMDTIHMQRNPDVPQPRMTPELEYLNEEDIDLSYTRRKKMEQAEQAAKETGEQGGEQTAEHAENIGRTGGEQDQQPVAEQQVAPDNKKTIEALRSGPAAEAGRRGSTWCW